MTNGKHVPGEGYSVHARKINNSNRIGRLTRANFGGGRSCVGSIFTETDLWSHLVVAKAINKIRGLKNLVVPLFPFLSSGE